MKKCWNEEAKMKSKYWPIIALTVEKPTEYWKSCPNRYFRCDIWTDCLYTVLIKIRHKFIEKGLWTISNFLILPGDGLRTE